LLMEVEGEWFGDDRRSSEVDLALRFLSPIADNRLEPQLEQPPAA
jgi:hypothetical protein